MKIFLTGKPGIGKTTVIKKFLQICNLKVKGFITEEIRERIVRKGFNIKTIPDGKTYLFASVDGAGMRFGKYFVDIRVLERVLEEIEKEKSDIIVIDEIGKMEMLSNKFRKFIIKIIKEKTPIVATLHRSFVKEFSCYGKIIQVSEKNRNILPWIILRYLNIIFKSNSHEVQKN